jgi:hypothetical protein
MIKGLRAIVALTNEVQPTIVVEFNTWMFNKKEPEYLILNRFFYSNIGNLNFSLSLDQHFYKTKNPIQYWIGFSKERR